MDYVNASYIRRPSYGPQGEAMVADNNAMPDYVGSQGPLSRTVANFLTMVYEQKSSHIVMLCQ